MNKRLVQSQPRLIALLSAGLFLTVDRSSAPRTHPQTTNQAAVKLLAGGHSTVIEISPRTWEPTEQISFNAIVDSVPHYGQGEIPKWKGNWERIVSQLKAAGETANCVVRVRVFSIPDKKVVWESQASFDAAALALEAQKLVPGRYVWSHRDPYAIMGFTIPANTLKQGTYRVLPDFMLSDKRPHSFNAIANIDAAEPLVVSPLNWNRLLLPAHVTDSPKLLRRTIQLANPGKKQFPMDTPDHCQARSVWAMQAYEGRVYIGYGDWDKDRGPLNLWSFEPKAGTHYPAYLAPLTIVAGTAPELLFLREYMVQEESVDLFRVCGNRLIVPGMDGSKEGGANSLLYGNVYIREKGYWRKLSTIPNARHVTDAIELDGKLYVVASSPSPTVLESTDGGLTWRDILPAKRDWLPEHLVTFGKDLLILNSNRGCCVYANGKVMAYDVDLLPGCRATQPHRCVSFAGGAVYTVFHNWGRVAEVAAPIYYMTDPKEGPRVISCFRNATVRDLITDGDALYALTVRHEGKGFVGEIYSTQNMTDWTRLAEFRVPAIPNSLARLNGVLYVGLANRGYNPEKYSDYRGNRYEYADRESGSIWQVAE